MLTKENEDLQDVVLSMEKQLQASKQKEAHLRENFQMVVGHNFELEQELANLRNDIPQQVTYFCSC